MEQNERSFFVALILLQVALLLMCLVGGAGMLLPLAVMGLILYVPLDIGVVCSRSRVMVETTPRRFMLILGCLVVPILMAFACEKMGLAWWIWR